MITVQLQQQSRINDALFAIHRNIAASLSGRELAAVARYSEQHFHRIFKQHLGESLHQYIRRVRLENAANLLTFSGEATAAIAEQCGFTSLSSFSRVFNEYFNMRPGAWRRQRGSTSKAAWMEDAEIAAAYRRIQPLSIPQPKLVERAPTLVAYVRHLGYGREIRQAWQQLQGWAISQGVDLDTQIGLHHSNPEWVPLKQCRYVACLGIEKPLLARTVVNQLTIPGGLHAVFTLTGCYGELLPWVHKIFSQWLPGSGFKLQTTPSFVQYRQNQFLSSAEIFDLEYHLPIRV